jgi:hypothetical protein
MSEVGAMLGWEGRMRDGDREALMGELRRAYELIHERKDVEAGLEMAMAIRYQLAQVGETSAYVEWLIAVGYDHSDKHLDACEHIDCAFTIDPLDPAYVNSRRVIYQNLRGEFLKLDLDRAGAVVAKMYEALTVRGQADWDCHIHVARWYAVQQRLDEMKAVLQAVTLLNPGCKEAWEGLAACARDEKRKEPPSA